MKSTYFENDDILQIRVSDKPIVREELQGWHTNISYAEDGSIVDQHPEFVPGGLAPSHQ